MKDTAFLELDGYITDGVGSEENEDTKYTGSGMWKVLPQPKGSQP